MKKAKKSKTLYKVGTLYVPVIKESDDDDVAYDAICFRIEEEKDDPEKILTLVIRRINREGKLIVDTQVVGGAIEVQIEKGEIREAEPGEQAKFMLAYHI